MYKLYQIQRSYSATNNKSVDKLATAKHGMWNRNELNERIYP